MTRLIPLKVELDDDNALLCPGCGGDNLHHDTVSAFMRSHEDARNVIVIVGMEWAEDQDETAPAPMPKLESPSARRDGVAVTFWCESCTFRGELTLSQHKGSTYMGWRE